MPRQERDSAVVHADMGERNLIKLPPPLELTELLLALKDVMHRAELFGHHAIRREALSVRQRMGELLSRLDDSSFHPFESLFDPSEGRPGIVVTFLAMLELAKELLIEIVQEEPLAPIYVKAKVSPIEASAELPTDAPEAGESALTGSSGE
jgi:segregation and condensation protein A